MVEKEDTSASSGRDTGTDAGGAAQEDDAHIPKPFVELKARRIIAILGAGTVISLIGYGFVSPGTSVGAPAPLQAAATPLLFYSVILLLLAIIVDYAGLSLPALFGPIPSPLRIGACALMAFPFIALSTASLYLFFLPLSYLWPSFAESLFCAEQPLFLNPGPDRVLEGAFTFLAVAVYAPLVEEILFRGLLLSRWSFKWRPPLAIAVSSLIFGLLHCNFIGITFVGYGLSVLYIRTRSLFVPIIVHASNNFIVLMAACGALLLNDTPQAPPTLAELRSGWWVPLGLAALAAPWAIKFVRNNIPDRGWRVPYLDAEIPNNQPTAM